MAAGEGRNAMDRTALHVMEDQSAGEAAVLARAIKEMDGWIKSLPVSSEWRWSFQRARAGLVAELAEIEGPARRSRRG